MKKKMMMTTSQPKLHDFGWGDTSGVRHVMSKFIRNNGILEADLYRDVSDMGYPPHDGDQELCESVRRIVFDLTGKIYSYVLITNGATHALNSYIYAKKSVEPSINHLQTNKLYFPFYKSIAKINNLSHMTQLSYMPIKSVRIVDSPSNPLGHFSNESVGLNTVWDAAYHSPTYCGVIKEGKLVTPEMKPAHEAMVISLNKLTGITGMRIGAILTDDPNLTLRCYDYIESTLCGASVPSQDMANAILNLDLQPFYVDSKRVLDGNREQLLRLGYLFGHQAIPANGMFALMEVDDRLKKLFIKANVKFKDGSEVGDDRNSVRINLGKTNTETRNMINAIRKADGKI